MRIGPLLLLGAGFGIAAWSFRKKRDCRVRFAEREFDRRDASLLGKESHLHDVGGVSASHIKEGIGRSTRDVPA
jgi:hypothetical protein